MISISLSAYAVSVRDKGNLDRRVELGSFNRRNDLLDVLEGYLNALKSTPQTDSSQSRHSTVQRLERSGRYLKGIFEAGEFGFKSEFRNIKNNQRSYVRDTVDAEMLPFYFLVYLPDNEAKGVVILQRFKQFGIHDEFITRFQSFFRQQFSNYAFRSTTLTNSEILKRYIDDARIVQVKFIQNKWPSDLADEVNRLTPVEKQGYIETIIHAGYKSSLPLKEKLTRLVNGKLNSNKLLEVEFPHDTVKVVLDINGRKRTIDAGSPFSFRSNFDISDDVKMVRGQPEYNSIDGLAQELLETLTEDLYKGKVRR